MVKMLANLKRRLSTLRTNSWHYKLAKFAMPRIAARNRKACSYYWLIVPGSTFVAGIKLLAFAFVITVCTIVAVIGSVLYPIWAIVAWFFGYKPVRWTLFGRLSYTENKGNPPKTYGYMLSAPKGDRDSYERVPRRGIAPYVVGLPMLIGTVVLVGDAYFDSFAITSFLYGILPWVAIAIAVNTVLLGLGIVFRKLVVPWLRSKYDKWCPDITWVEEPRRSVETADT